VKRRSIRFLLAVLLGWYIVGPVVETVDRWDDLRAEMRDIARSAGGAVTMAVAGFAIALVLKGNLKARYTSVRAVLAHLRTLSLHPLLRSDLAAEPFFHSPPSPLRI
jgi:hypothetical protein